MAFGRPHGPNDPSVMSSIETALSTTRQGNILVRLWHWRYETGLIIGTALAALFIWSSLGTTALIVAAAAAAVALAGAITFAPAREWLIARAWCVVTPHRVRTGCTQAWVQTRDGRLPTVVYTAPTEFGERVMLWCRAGIVPRDLIAAREILRAACWAADVRVVVNDRRSHIVVLEVVRRLPSEPPVNRQPGIPDWPFQDRGGGDGPGSAGPGGARPGSDSDGPEEAALYAGVAYGAPSE